MNKTFKGLIKKSLIFYFLILIFALNSYAQLTNNFDSSSYSLDMDSLNRRIQGIWHSSNDSSYQINVFNKDWIITVSDADTMRYTYEIRKTVDNHLKKVLMLILLDKEKDWSSYEGKLKSDEAVFYIISNFENNVLVLSDLSGEVNLELKKVIPQLMRESFRDLKK